MVALLPVQLRCQLVTLHLQRCILLLQSLRQGVPHSQVFLQSFVQCCQVSDVLASLLWSADGGIKVGRFGQIGQYF